MAASTPVGKQCDDVFKDIYVLGDQLKNNIHDSVLFQVENGIDYIFSTRLNIQLVTALDIAGRNSTNRYSSTVASHHFQQATSAVTDMSTEMGKCKQVFSLSKVNGWTPELETHLFVCWKSLAWKISRLSVVVLERAVTPRLLLGGTSDDVSKTIIEFDRLLAYFVLDSTRSIPIVCV
jgi:hypothetical protein